MSTPGRRYHLRRVLGEGAFGRVYLAEQESDGGFRRLVALKVLHEEVAKKREAERRMRDEARVLGQLQHRNIVAVLDLVRLESRWAIVMDHVTGVDLEHLVVAGPVPPAVGLAIGVGVARALAAAHDAADSDGQPLDVVHRDIKPSNVRLTADGEVKVLDFGVARFSLDSRESETRGPGWIGTERYMAPERILGQGDTPAGDVYALGATVFELLVGEPLGRTPALPGHHRKMLDEALERLALHAPDHVPPAWADAVAALEQSLVADPAERPSAAELAEAWGAAVASLPGESLAAFAARVVPGLAEAEQGEPASGVLSEGSRDLTTMMLADEPEALDGRRRPAWTLAAAGFALIVGGLGVAAFALAGLVATGMVEVPGTVPPDVVDVEPVDVEPVEPASPEAPPVDPVDPVDAEPAVEERPKPAPPRRSAPLASPRGAPVKAALFVLENAQGIRVRCGEVSAEGTASARIATFLAGSCEVSAYWLGSEYTARVVVETARTVRCKVDEGEGMSCS